MHSGTPTKSASSNNSTSPPASSGSQQQGAQSQDTRHAASHSEQHATPASSSQGRGSEAQPTPSQSPNASLEMQWRAISSGIKSNATAGAEVLVRHASSVSHLEELMNRIIAHMRGLEWERGELRRQLQQDRAEFAAQAKLLSGHFQTSMHRSTALQVAHEALQAELQHSKEGAEAQKQDNLTLLKQLADLQGQVAELQAQQSQAASRQETLQADKHNLQQQLEHHLALVQELKHARAQLQSQVRSMVSAEQQLTGHLKATHTQIDEQLQLLRDQLKGERQKRMAAQKKKAEMSQQVERMAQQLEMLTQQEEGGTPPKPGPRLHTATRAATKRSSIKLARGPSSSPAGSRATPTARARPSSLQRSPLRPPSASPSALTHRLKPQPHANSTPHAALKQPVHPLRPPSTSPSTLPYRPQPHPPASSTPSPPAPKQPTQRAASSAAAAAAPPPPLSTRHAQLSLRRMTPPSAASGSLHSSASPTSVSSSAAPFSQAVHHSPSDTASTSTSPPPVGYAAAAAAPTAAAPLHGAHHSPSDTASMSTNSVPAASAAAPMATHSHAQAAPPAVVPLDSHVVPHRLTSHSAVPPSPDHIMTHAIPGGNPQAHHLPHMETTFMGWGLEEAPRILLRQTYPNKDEPESPQLGSRAPHPPFARDLPLRHQNQLSKPTNADNQLPWGVPNGQPPSGFQSFPHHVMPPTSNESPNAIQFGHPSSPHRGEGRQQQQQQQQQQSISSLPGHSDSGVTGQSSARSFPSQPQPHNTPFPVPVPFPAHLQQQSGCGVTDQSGVHSLPSQPQPHNTPFPETIPFSAHLQQQSGCGVSDQSSAHSFPSQPQPHNAPFLEPIPSSAHLQQQSGSGATDQSSAHSLPDRPQPQMAPFPEPIPFPAPSAAALGSHEHSGSAHSAQQYYSHNVPGGNLPFASPALDPLQTTPSNSAPSTSTQQQHHSSGSSCTPPHMRPTSAGPGPAYYATASPSPHVGAGDSGASSAHFHQTPIVLFPPNHAAPPPPTPPPSQISAPNPQHAFALPPQGLGVAAHLPAVTSQSSMGVTSGVEQWGTFAPMAPQGSSTTPPHALDAHGQWVQPFNFYTCVQGHGDQLPGQHSTGVAAEGPRGQQQAADRGRSGGNKGGSRAGSPAASLRRARSPSAARQGDAIEHGKAAQHGKGQGEKGGGAGGSPGPMQKSAEERSASSSGRRKSAGAWVP